MAKQETYEQQQARLKKIVDDFNQSYPVGTRVILRRDIGDTWTKVATPARILSYHSAVAWFEGMASCYAIEGRVRPAPGPQPVLKLDKTNGLRTELSAEEFKKQASSFFEGPENALRSILNRQNIQTSIAVYYLNADWVVEGGIDAGKAQAN